MLIPSFAGILFKGEGGNFRFLIMQKSFQDAANCPIRGPIGSLANFGPLWALQLTSACFSAHSLILLFSRPLNERRRQFYEYYPRKYYAQYISPRPITAYRPHSIPNRPNYRVQHHKLYFLNWATLVTFTLFNIYMIYNKKNNNNNNNNNQTNSRYSNLFYPHRGSPF